MAEDGSDRGSTSKGNGGLSSMDSMESHRWVFQDEENSEIDYEDNGDDDGDDFTLQNDMDSEDEDSLYQKLIRTGPRIDSFGVEALEVPGAHRSEYEDASLGKSIFLVFQTLGVVFGDVGTSPLYTFSVMFSRAPIETNADIIGALSLVLYTLILIPLIKYILIVLLANDDGEGGTFALYSLICRHAKISLLPNQLTSDTRISSFRLKVPSAELERSLKIKEHLENSLTMKKLVLVLVLAGTSMVIADGVVTPAMSVISAVRGLKVAFPAVEQDHVVMISVAYLIILFSVQKYGTSKVGLVIGPALFIWFCSLGGIGIYNLVKHDSSVVKAFNPIHIYYYFKRNPTKAWYSLGGCLLCATGSEAMFADLCYFPVRTIQITFVFLVLPCLMLGYMGQAAYLMDNYGDPQQAFFSSIPDGGFWWVFLIANFAALIASRTMTTATFSCIKQSSAIGCFPRLKIVHTSRKFMGQIYIPVINWFLMASAVLLVCCIASTNEIGNAYGIAEIGVMMMTTFLVTLVMLLIWQINIITVIIFSFFFLGMELLFLSSVLSGIGDGSWIILLFSIVVFLIMCIWNYGSKLKYETEVKKKMSMDVLRQLGCNLGNGPKSKFLIPPQLYNYSNVGKDEVNKYKKVKIRGMKRKFDKSEGLGYGEAKVFKKERSSQTRLPHQNLPTFVGGTNMSCQSDYNSDPPHAPLLKPRLSPSSPAASPPTATPHRSSDGNSTTSHQSETAPTASMDDNETAPPLPLPPPPPPPKNTSFPVREDCWSEEATFTLIEAWGDRFVELNRGNLRQKHWQEVADSVNARHGHVKKSRRTDIQCKNRIDTLKKKFKVEKSKMLELGADNYVSPWPFFAPLDSLIGSSFKPSTQTPTPPPPRKRIRTPPSLPALPPPPSSVPVAPRSKRPAPPAFQPSNDTSFFRRNFSVMAAAAAAIDGADEDSDTSWSSGGNGARRSRLEKADETGSDAYHHLAEAIGRFAEVYERVEEAKQRQMVELEKQRMQFTKDLELQRMKLLMESQVQLEKLKRSKRNSEPDFSRSDEGDHSASIS